MMARKTFQRSTSQFVQIKDVDRMWKEMDRLRLGFKKLPKQMARKAVREAVMDAVKGYRTELRNITPVQQGYSSKTKVTKSGKVKRVKRGGTLKKGIRTAFKYSTKGAGFFKLRIGFDRAKAPHAILVEDGTKNRKTQSGAGRGRVVPRKFNATLAAARAPGIAQQMAQNLRESLEKYLKASFRNG